MIRRAKAGDSLIGSPGPNSWSSGHTKVTATVAPRSGSPIPKIHDRRSPVTFLCKLLFVIVVGLPLLISVVSKFSPASVPSSIHNAEQKIYEAEQMVEQKMYEAEQIMEHEVQGLLAAKLVPPDPNHSDNLHHHRREESNVASEAMLKQSSSWVDGEKKLKKQLRALKERQMQGNDLGVPVLTRWLGNDIPAWPGEGIDVEEWRERVEARYAEMREEEEKWKEKVSKFMETGL